MRDGFDPKFVPWVFQSESFIEFATNRKIGSTNPHVRWRDVAEFEFDLPPLDQQCRIAEILWAVDETDRQYFQLEQTLVQLFQALAFEHFPKPEKSRHCFAPLGEICLRQPQSGLYKGPAYVGRGIKTVNMGEMFGNDLIDQSVSMQRMELTPKEVENYSLTPNDLLFGRRSIVLEGAGKCSMVGNLTEPTIFESSVLRVTIDPKKASSGFIFDWFNSPAGTKQIRRIRSHTTVAGITGSALKNVLVPLLPLKEQQALFETLTDQRTRIALQKNARAKVIELRKSLLEAFLEGSK